MIGNNQELHNYLAKMVIETGIPWNRVTLNVMMGIVRRSFSDF